GKKLYISTLTPSFDEMKQKWWRMSLKYFHNLSKASTSSDGPSKKKKSRVKHKLVVSRTHVRIDFHRKDFCSLTENPHNRVALMKKITDIEVEFRDTSNVAAECMFVDKNPSCGSDVKAGNKESMCVDSSIKVAEQNKFDQNMTDKNLIHDFDQTVEWENLLNDAISFKNSITQVDEPCQARFKSRMPFVPL
nr:hypothetical protein [Tanacetum cinerariifolium]